MHGLHFLRLLISRKRKDAEQQILQHIGSCSNAVTHTMINHNAFILSQADKEEVDLQKYRDKVMKQMQGWYRLNGATVNAFLTC